VQGYLSTHIRVVALRYLNSCEMVPTALYAYSASFPDTGQTIRVLAVTSSPTGFSVCRITTKVICQFRWILMLWLGLSVEKWVNLWWWSGPRCGFWIIFHFPHHWRFRNFQRSINISHTVTGRFLRTVAKWPMPTREWIHYILVAIW